MKEIRLSHYQTTVWGTDAGEDVGEKVYEQAYAMMTYGGETVKVFSWDGVLLDEIVNE